MIAQEVLDITDLVAEDLPEEAATPGLTHLWLLTVIDRTGLSHWLLGFGFFLAQAIIAFFILILERYPDPAMYQNGVAFSAISGFSSLSILEWGAAGTETCCNSFDLTRVLYR